MSIEQVRSALANHPEIELAIVFGSVAGARAREDSDIDVAVQAGSVLDAAQKMQLMADIATTTGRPVDLVDLRTAGEPLLGQILQHGQRIRGTDTDRAELMIRHVYDTEDFLPCVTRMFKEACLDRLIVDRKLDSLRRCLSRVREKTPADVATLASDADLQDIVVLNLSRTVQICVDLAVHMLSTADQPPPATMGEALERLAQSGRLPADLALRLRKAVGFRNLAVHNYSTIDWAIVHAIASRHLDDFEDFARIVDAA